MSNARHVVMFMMLLLLTPLLFCVALAQEKPRASIFDEAEEKGSSSDPAQSPADKNLAAWMKVTDRDLIAARDAYMEQMEKAMADYERGLAQLEKRLQEQSAAAAAGLNRSIDTAKKNATRKGDLEMALLVRDLSPPYADLDGTRKLQRRLEGTKWKWGDDVMRLHHRGTGSVQTSRSLVTVRWAAVDEKHVVLIKQDNGYTYKLVFDPTLNSYRMHLLAGHNDSRMAPWTGVPFPD